MFATLNEIQNLAYVMHVIICVMSITLLVQVVFGIHRIRRDRFEIYVFRIVCGAAMVFCLLEEILHTVIVFFPHTVLPVKFSLEISYHLAIVFVAFSWFLFASAIQKSKFIHSKRRFFIAIAPIAIYALLVVTTPLTKIIFLAKDGFICRSNYFPFLAGLPYLYIFVPSVSALVRAFQKKNYIRKVELLSLAQFAFFPVIMSVLQYFVIDTPLAAAGISFTLFQVYDAMRTSMISKDPLTNLNNRNELYRLVERKKYSIDSEKNYYLLVMDVDFFKPINDTYGHAEGDRALVIVADVLRKIASENSSFCCRYGGDEFILFYECKEDASVETLCEIIDLTLAKAVAENNLPYNLKLSIGYAKWEGQNQYYKDLFQEADAALYAVKAARPKDQKSVY